MARPLGCLQSELLRIALKHDCVQAHGAVAILEHGRYLEIETLLWAIESLAESNKRLRDLAIEAKRCEPPPIVIFKDLSEKP